MYSVYVLWLAFLAGLILIYGHWYDWSGDWFWGPRFLLFASFPASFALAVWQSARGTSWIARAITLLLLAFSVWVGINGAVCTRRPCCPTASGPTVPTQPPASICHRPAYSGVHW